MTTVTIPNGTPATAKNGDCGCHSRPESCCRLECLTAPRFFCGQLLTDQDMTALVDWTRDKLRLARYRHGWGVVCGLDVRCDPKSRSSLIVSPGYAVSCCGDDIVVCKDAPVDLSNWCKPLPDRCAGFKIPPPTGTVKVGCVEMPASELRILDVSIGYKEKKAAPTTALGRGSCGQTASCEYTRTNESYTISVVQGVESSDPVQAAADAWLANYKKCLDVIDQFMTRFAKYNPKAETALDEVRTWLLNWLDSHMLNDFCFVRDCICGATAAPDEQTLARWLFWIVQDCRNALAACDCYACTSSEGVPLARVWLRAQQDGPCRVLRVDPYPPFRRDLSPQCWPAPLGFINLGRLLWHRLGDACEIASRLGVKVNDTNVSKFELPPTLAELKARLDCNPIINCGSEVILQYYDTGNFDYRVVGFCGERFRQQPAGTDQPAANTRDDLTRLPNIGTGRQETLYQNNITTYKQISAMSAQELSKIFPTLADQPIADILAEAKSLSQP